MKWILVGTDALLVLASLLLAVNLRFEGDVPVTYQGSHLIWLNLGIVMANLASYWFHGLYHKVWRYAGVHELLSISRAVTVSYLPFAAWSFATGGQACSRSIIIIAWLFNIMLVGAMRFILRLSSEPLAMPRLPGARKVLIVGANDEGEAILRELARQPTRPWSCVGFVDEDSRKVGTTIRGSRVLGTLDDMPRLLAELCVDEVILGVPKPPVVRRLISLCASAPHVELKLVPSISDVVQGRTRVSQIREVRIEDLLEREPVQLRLETVASCIKGRRVLVTGAGGSIGSEICRQLSRLEPVALILLGRGENSIHEIAIELGNLTSIPLSTVIADVRDLARMRKIFREHRPQVVFHAAAHKHVPLMEANPEEAMSVNVLGTRNLVGLSAEFGVERFILLSTDKAVNPTSLMGASKRLAELLVLEAAARCGQATRYMAVRFGNVLGSRGSVIPTFRRQIELGGPVTVTDPEMTRFFMTIPEAVTLVIQAAALGDGGEIYILDMGEPVRILDLARNMIRLSGYEPETDIPIKVLGPRPGEKTSEELLNTGEEATATAVPKIRRVTSPEPCRVDIGETLQRIEHCLAAMELGADTPETARKLRGILGLGPAASPRAAGATTLAIGPEPPSD